MRAKLFCWAGLVLILTGHGAFAQEVADPGQYIRDNYVRQDFQIPARDGVRLYTIVYSPKDTSRTYPILMMRTPYSIGPYNQGESRHSLGPNPLFIKEGYIFAYQDVRGRFMSEGEFDNMRPHLDKRASEKDIDESTDTYDTIDYLVKNVANNNGKAGLYGISYPGFYSSAGMINAHSALKAVSPQAPIADWFFDDFFHHGAFFLPHAFNFFSFFGQARPKPTPNWPGGIVNYGTPDGYQFFLDIGSLKNVNPRYYKHRIAFWDTMSRHPNYDDFWKARNLLPHLKNVAPAVMTVGGWFDAEDLYGALNTYQAVEKQNPGVFNVLVMGPWAHGAWAGRDGSRLGNINFGSATSKFFQKEMELPFFNHFLKGEGEHGLPEAYMFETGTNRWRKFEHWPPKVQITKLYARGSSALSYDPPTQEAGFDAFPSDPHRPVPFTEAISVGMTREYMTDDQRFASRRPDVAVYQTGVLDKDVTLAGKVRSELFVSTSGTDSDWVVKLIDVFPGDAKAMPGSSRPMGGYQMMVRSEVIRGRFRNSYSRPEPFVPNEPAKISLDLQDVLHTFQKGHRIMVQIHSTWFPLVDRNPQKYVPNIFMADDQDFVKTTQRIFRSPGMPTAIEVGILAE